MKSLMIEIGKVNRLEVVRDSEPGLYLQSKDDDEVLLPNCYVVEDEMAIGSLIDVFVYTDSEDRPVATTKMPYAKIGEYGYFTVVDYKSYGAFVNWGLPKDLFVPLSQQKEYFNIGSKYILRVCLDEKTNRLYATQKIGKYFSYDTTNLRKNQEVDLLVLAQTPLGYKVIVDSLYEGMLFKNEIFETLRKGDRKKGYIKNIRRDGKLDISLRAIGKKANSDSDREKILSIVAQRGGEIPFTYKSRAEDIKELFGLSKKSYKRALTSLIESNEIKLTDNSISIRPNP
ncbi:S1 RNA binding domain [hydrothermal vent metagenome]|uniref:S1 RNA binding domain n=1 Tax=hydrothermal vent metagenome TaxID=652676 RepID=A0A1W1CB61_9ZZZZ